MQVSFALEPEQPTRWLAVLERLRKKGHAEAKDELLLTAFAALAEAECTRVQNALACQAVIYHCEACGADDAANLVTLCEACHRLLHEGSIALAAALPPPG